MMKFWTNIECQPSDVKSMELEAIDGDSIESMKMWATSEET